MNYLVFTRGFSRFEVAFWRTYGARHRGVHSDRHCCSHFDC